MIKILILAYDFPPYVSVGGLRPYSWYKYLNEFGIFPVVVTRQWGNKYGNYLDYVAPGDTDSILIDQTERGVIIRSPYKPNLSNRLLLKYGETRFRILRKAISAFYEFAQWILPVGPKYELYKAAKEYLKINKVDCIIATGDPFILFQYASRLGKKHNVPWIADYRDPWIQDKTRERSFFHRQFDAFFERKLIKRATTKTTVAKHFEALIGENSNRRDFKIILNGFDEELVKSSNERKQTQHALIIAMAGTIYKFNPIELFLSVLEEFIVTSKANIVLKFYGINNQSEIEKFLAETCKGLLKTTHFYPRTNNQSVLKKLSEANVLLLFNYYSFPGTKIYDYLALRRKILLCFSDDPTAKELKKKHYNLKEFPHLSNSLQADMITATNSGIVVRNTQHLKEVLKELSDEFQAKGYIECNSHGIEQYSRRHQTERLAEVIKEVVVEYKKGTYRKRKSV